MVPKNPEANKKKEEGYYPSLRKIFQNVLV
jgi:hypothetical protein